MPKCLTEIRREKFGKIVCIMYFDIERHSKLVSRRRKIYLY